MKKVIYDIYGISIISIINTKGTNLVPLKHFRSNLKRPKMTNIINPFEALDNRLNIIETLLKSMVEQKTEPNRTSNVHDYITRHEAAVELGVCITTIDNLAKNGLIKKYRNGGRVVRLKRSELGAAFATFKGGWSRQFEKNK
jgi:excisionase family DNA binding protein